MRRNPLYTRRERLSIWLEENGFLCAMWIVIAMLMATVGWQRYLMWDAQHWVCSRASYDAVEIQGMPRPLTPCAEETHVRTGETRITDYGRMKRDGK